MEWREGASSHDHHGGRRHRCQKHVFYFEKNISPEISEHVHTRVPEIFAIRALSDALAIAHGEGGETHVAILVAIGMIVVIAFRLATDGTFSVSSAVEFDLKDSKIVRKDFIIT